MIKGQIKGIGSLMAKFKDVQNVVVPVAREELEISAFDVQRTAKQSIMSIKGSKRETRYKPKRDVIVSDPGESPNTDLGTLASSIGVDIDQEKLEAVIGTNYKIGEYLEMGTKTMKARPWLFPAFEGKRQEMFNNIKNRLLQAIKKAGGTNG